MTRLVLLLPLLLMIGCAKKPEIAWPHCADDEGIIYSAKLHKYGCAKIPGETFIGTGSSGDPAFSGTPQWSKNPTFVQGSKEDQVLLEYDKRSIQPITGDCGQYDGDKWNVVPCGEIAAEFVPNAGIASNGSCELGSSQCEINFQNGRTRVCNPITEKMIGLDANDNPICAPESGPPK
jgi:hypothetical protein